MKLPDHILQHVRSQKHAHAVCWSIIVHSFLSMRPFPIGGELPLWRIRHDLNVLLVTCCNAFVSAISFFAWACYIIPTFVYHVVTLSAGHVFALPKWGMHHFINTRTSLRGMFASKTCVAGLWYSISSTWSLHSVALPIQKTWVSSVYASCYQYVNYSRCRPLRNAWTPVIEWYIIQILSLHVCPSQMIHNILI